MPNGSSLEALRTAMIQMEFSILNNPYASGRLRAACNAIRVGAPMHQPVQSPRLKTLHGLAAHTPVPAPWLVPFPLRVMLFVTIITSHACHMGNPKPTDPPRPPA
jgi:hypothetical protein